MKRIVLAFVLLLIMVMPSYGADTAMNALTDRSASLTLTDYAVGYKGTTPYRFTMASILGLGTGTVTNTYLCVGDAGGKIQCTVAPATYQTALTYPVTGIASPTAGYLTKWGASGNTLDDGLKIGTFTNAKWCSYSTAGGMACTENAPGGSGDVTSVGDCADGACLDGSSDGGTYVRLYDGTSAYTAITAGVRTLTLAPSNANAESMLITFGDNSNVVALSSASGAVVNISGSAATATGTAGGLTGTPNITVGTISAGATGFSVDADGDVTAKSVTITRVAGSASSGLFYEVPANGDNYVTLKSADSLAGDYTVVLPSGNGTIALNDQTMYIGTTQVAINRSSAALTLAGLTLTTPVIGAATGTSLLVTGRLDGTVGMVLSTAGSATTISSTDNKASYYMNQGDSDAHSIYTLPTAAAGLQYCVRNYTGITRVVTFQTSAAGQYIDLDGTNSASGGFIHSDAAAGVAACVVGVDATHWMAYTQKGTWTRD